MAEELTFRQEVRVFDVNGKRMGQPEGGWRGEVVKVGRKLVHIEYGERLQADAFRIDDGRKNDNYGHRYFLTLDQVALRDREHSARTVLREHRISVDFGADITLEQLEALAAVFEQGG